MGMEVESSSSDAIIKRWEPASFFDGQGGIQSRSTDLLSSETALVVINTPIARKDIFSTLWASATLKYCADGGANRLFDTFRGDPFYLPDLIKGDLDSIRKDVRDFYTARGVPIVTDKDQYATDLGKCIKSLQDAELKSGRTYQLVVCGGLSGRFDQTAHTIHALYKLRKSRDTSWILSEESLTCVLDAGRHELRQPRKWLGPTCGILPIGVESAHVTTTGLEWNLDDTETSFDGMLSTSNHLMEEIITVITDKPVIWTVALRSSP